MSFSGPDSFHLPVQETYSENPLIAVKDKSFCASQTSLASNMSKLSFKIGKVFSSKPKKNDPVLPTSGRKKRNMPNPETCDEELPYVTFHRPNPSFQSNYLQSSEHCNKLENLPDLIQHQRLVDVTEVY